MGVAVLMDAVSGGGYISPWKLIPPVLLLVVWARLLTWADKDAPDAHLPRVPLNLSFLSGLVLAYALFFFVPSFWLGLGILVLLFGGEVGAYLYVRHKRVGLSDLKQEWRDFVHGLTHRGGKSEEVQAGRIGFINRSGAVPVPKAEAPERPAYDAVQTSLTEAMIKGAEQIDLAPEAGGLATKFVVDGVVYRGAVLDAATGGNAIGYLKRVTALNVEEVRKPQQGTLKVVLDRQKHELAVQTAGTRAGEYLRIMVDPKTRRTQKLDQLGLTDRQFEQVKELVKKDKAGVVLVATPKAQGLTTLLYAILRAHDAFIEHIHTVERDAALDLEGITQNKLASNSTPAEETKQVAWIISQEPDVLMIDQVNSQQTATELAKFAKTGKRVYVGMRAGSTFEAVEQWRKLVGDDATATESLRLVVVGRVLRQLCSACKSGYTPDPATLRKLGISPDKVTTLYQARTQPMRDQKGNPIPCEFCHDLRFKGRRGIFETLFVDDPVREAATGGHSAMNQAMRRQRGKYLQEEALALVELGTTSVQEVLRVLKSGGDAADQGGSGGGAAPVAPTAPIAPTAAPTAPRSPPPPRAPSPRAPAPARPAPPLKKAPVRGT